VAIVTVADETPNETTCLWPGKIAVFDDEASAYCSDPFSEGNDCWLMVLNNNLGSFATTKAELHVGEHYLGRPVGVIPTEQEVGDPIDVPIFAIRIEENEVFHVTIPSPGVGAGMTIALTLPDGRSVTATNWSADTALSSGDKALCFKDLTDGTSLIVRAAAPSALPPG
jgi:hypothetical protein